MQTANLDLARLEDWKAGYRLEIHRTLRILDLRERVERLSILRILDLGERHWKD